jgi:hypothetical protein
MHTRVLVTQTRDNITGGIILLPNYSCIFSTWNKPTYDTMTILEGILGEAKENEVVAAPGL